jgi:type I restriction enzyme R subunit
MPWRVIDEKGEIEKGEPDLHVIIEEIFEKKKFLEMIRFFIVFEDQGGGVLAKKMAGYHQRHAANAALESTVRASSEIGDKRAGVIWHTQGSGKSLTMVFYAGRIVSHKDMRNPTIVVLTDRNDLDDQLFGVFARCDEVIRQKPVKAESRANLRALLQTSSGGVIFTTVHKFFPIDDEDNMPLLSERRNIVVIADEAHRSQYDFIDGYARHMRDALPNASFIGFTGTPIELSDKSTRSVFGDYVSIYDIEQAVEDGATVPIYYESRIAKLAIRENELPLIDEQFEEVTEGERSITRRT